MGSYRDVDSTAFEERVFKRVSHSDNIDDNGVNWGLYFI